MMDVCAIIDRMSLYLTPVQWIGLINGRDGKTHQTGVNQNDLR